MTDAARPRLRDWASLIKLSHSVFALPFALIALLVATDGRPGIALSMAIVAAVVSARAAAMAFNRFVDRHIDARNPRTREREIPRGAISPRAALTFTLVCAATFVAVAGWLGPTCLALSVPTLGLLLGYSYAKRFTATAHVWLGLALGLAPPATWIAATGTIDASILGACLLGLGVTLWVAGFDVLYACQDFEFDRREGLRSLPVRLGIAGALRVARLLHFGAVVCFFGFGVWAELGGWFAVGAGAAAALLCYEHRLVRADDLSRIHAAFFTMNGLVSLLLLGCTVLALHT